jgi:hypothetical protein
MNQVIKIQEYSAYSALKTRQYFSALKTMHIVNEPSDKNTGVFGLFGLKNQTIFFGLKDHAHC